MAATINPSDLASFTTHLQSSTRIMALLGAGLSASSGLPTFRGPGGYWRNYDATLLATPSAFRSDPGLVWQFYSYRRHMALNARPNRAHLALAELARRRPGFITLSQNVDGLSPRAGHPQAQLKLLHGSLYDIKCFECDYVRRNDFTDPIVPALAIPQGDPNQVHNELQARTRTAPTGALSRAIQKKADMLGAAAAPQQNDDEPASNPAGTNETSLFKPTTTKATTNATTPKYTNPLIHGLDISQSTTHLAPIPKDALPHCPQCQRGLLRPGVVWFGEALPTDVLDDVDAFISDHNSSQPIDLMLVIGTSSKVYPAAGYTEIARSKGARIAVINMDPADAVAASSDGIGGGGMGLRPGVDWFFQGDAAQVVPKLLESVVGEIADFEELERHGQVKLPQAVEETL